MSLCMDALEMLRREASATQGTKISDPNVSLNNRNLRIEFKKTTAILDTSKKSMNMIINRLVDFAHASSGVPLEPSLGHFNLMKFLQIIVYSFDDTRIDFKIKNLTGLAVETLEVVTDGNWLLENISCLISNALKFSDRTEPVDVTVQLIRTIVEDAEEDSEGRSVNTANNTGESDERKAKVASLSALGMKISVQDSGIGISDDELEMLFTYESRPSSTLTGGAGLGLYTLSCRVNALNGQYGYMPGPNRIGSIFWFMIPMGLKTLEPRLAVIPKYGAGMKLDSESSESFCRDGPSQHHRLAVVVPSAGSKSFSFLPSKSHTKEVEISLTVNSANFNKGFSSQNKSNFQSSVPLSLENEHDADDPEPQLDKLRTMRILVVDDSLSIRKMSAMLLEKQGHVVVQAVNGKDALELMVLGMKDKSFAYDLVLMDIQMPVMDGIEAITRYREFEASFNAEEFKADASSARKPLNIIAMSACSDASITEKALKAGMNYFIPKPFSIKVFNDLVQEISW